LQNESSFFAELPRLVVPLFEIERFAHYFDGELFEPRRGFGIGTLPREDNAAVRDCS
jgi:hypothetical protein